MAEELKEKFDVSTKLVKGSGGVFEVILEDELIFSKKALGRFPEPGEVANLMADHAAAS